MKGMDMNGKGRVYGGEGMKGRAGKRERMY